MTSLLGLVQCSANFNKLNNIKTAPVNGWYVNDLHPTYNRAYFIKISVCAPTIQKGPREKQTFHEI